MPASGPRFSYSHYLVRLIARAEAASSRLVAAHPDRRAVAVALARRESARLSARLDASPLTDDTAAAVDSGRMGDARPQAPVSSGGGWAQTLRIEGLGSQEVAAVEYANLLAAWDAEADLATRLFEAPADTLTSLHIRLCRWLVDADRAVRPRLTERAVHDGAQGKIIYRAARPDEIPGLLEGLWRWLGRASAGLPAVVVAGVVHERLLEWQPFEAANGRLARAAARLVLRARGLDPHGAGVTERLLAADPVGYYAEVAATVRRRGDLSRWLERHAEAVAYGLEAAADAVDPRPKATPPAAGVAVHATLEPGEVVTQAGYAAKAGVGLDLADQHLGQLESAGLLAVVPGTGGLRYRRTG